MKYNQKGVTTLYSIVNAMRKSDIGGKITKDMIDASHNIRLKLDKGERPIYMDGSGKITKERTSEGIVLLGYSQPTLKGKELSQYDVTIYEGSVNYQRDTEVETIRKDGADVVQVKYADKSTEDVIGAFWDPSGVEIPTTKGAQTNPIIDLAHEMFHVVDANNGKLNDKQQYGVAAEWHAVYKENLLRGQLGQPLRTHYIKSVDPSGTFVGGSGVRMITPGNKPIKPLGY